ncbi:MAG: isochorismatase family protein [Planctomycetota bacterium]
MGFGISKETKNEFCPENIQLLIVDIQEKLFPKIDHREELLKNTQILIETAKILNIPIILSEQYPSGLGQTLPEIKSLLPENTPSVEKLHFSCMQHPGFESKLQDRKLVMVVGIETHVCIYQTVSDLILKDYWVWVPADAVGSRTKLNWKTGLSLMEREGAWIASTENLIFRLLKTAGTENFKKIAKLLK